MQKNAPRTLVGLNTAHLGGAVTGALLGREAEHHAMKGMPTYEFYLFLLWPSFAGSDERFVFALTITFAHLHRRIPGRICLQVLWTPLAAGVRWLVQRQSGARASIHCPAWRHLHLPVLRSPLAWRFVWFLQQQPAQEARIPVIRNDFTGGARGVKFAPARRVTHIWHEKEWDYG